MAVGARVILGPQRESLAPVALETRIVSIQRAGRKHQPREGELGLVLVIRRDFELEILDAGILMERTLVRDQRSGNRQAAAEPPTEVAERHSVPGLIISRPDVRPLPAGTAERQRSGA